MKSPRIPEYAEAPKFRAKISKLKHKHKREMLRQQSFS